MGHAPRSFRDIFIKTVFTGGAGSWSVRMSGDGMTGGANYKFQLTKTINRDGTFVENLDAFTEQARQIYLGLEHDDD